MKKLKFAVLGTGFWSQFQLGAWTELENVECVAVYNRTKPKAEALAKRFGVPRVYDDPVELFMKEDLDFVDIITDVDTHSKFVEMAVEHGVQHIICQKPMAPDYTTACNMVKLCSDKGRKLYIHENYRWQVPVRRFKEILDSGIIGKPFKARVSFLSGYPVFENQPFLRELDHFILTDMGSHVFDICRFLFGEVESLWCQTGKVSKGIKGEDMAAVMMHMESGIPLYSELSYASRMENDSFSTVWVLVEGSKGSISLGPGFEITTVVNGKISREKCTFPSYSWADPDYIVNHASGLDINLNILNDILGIGSAENTGADNLKTVEIVWASYESAKTGKMVRISDFQNKS